jgi:hypothetical protein
MKEKRQQMMVDFQKYRDQKMEDYAHYKARRVALRDGKYWRSTPTTRLAAWLYAMVSTPTTRLAAWLYAMVSGDLVYLM